LPTADVYALLPPLGPIIHLLSPTSGSEALFDIQGNSKKDGYYDDIANHVDILSKVLTDIDGYVSLEKDMSKQTTFQIVTGPVEVSPNKV